MNNEFIIIKRDKLPQGYNEVIEAKKLINNEGLSISEACKKVSISRSTFYKYVNDIFETSEGIGKKGKLMIKTLNHKGILSSVLNIIANHDGNILTINQDLPIKDIAYINITIELDRLDIPFLDLVGEIKLINEIKNVDILAVE